MNIFIFILPTVLTIKKLRDGQNADDFAEAQQVCYATDNRPEPAKREKHPKNNVLF